MGHAFCGLAIALLLTTTTWAEKIVLANKSSQPLVYEAKFSGNDEWSKPLTLAPGKRHGYTTDSRLVIRFDTGDGQTTTVLRSGQHFQYRQDADGRGELANDCVDEPGRPKVRRLTVLAVAEESYRRTFPDWKDRIAEIVATTSNYFEEAFSIRLKLVECRPWEHEAVAGGNAEQSLDSLVQIESSNAELVIGWIGVVQATPKKPGWYGLSWWRPFASHLLIADTESRLLFGAAQQLIHCLAGTFGAFDVPGRTSIMQKLLDNVPYPFEFGAVPSQMIQLTREVDFRVGVRSLKPDNAKQVQDLYRKYHHPDDAPSADPISKAYRN